MIILDQIKQYIGSFDSKEIFKYAKIYFGVCVVVVIGLMVRHVYMQKDMQNKMVMLNKSRRLVQEILTKYQVVQQQKNKVEIALKQNKTFNIQKFFQDLAQKHNVTGQSSVKFNRQKLPNGYIEESLQVTINQVDTKTMCDILLDIEQEPIVYTVMVDISKVSMVRKISFSVSIATLRAEE